MAIEWDAVHCEQAVLERVKCLFRETTRGDERGRPGGTGFADGSILFSRRSEQLAVGDDGKAMRQRCFREA
jgi:hypothetical protein